ncbi:hypothetical protein M3Y97_00543000 [Aphelenchoides bicaudatus]|nr:hypothetical protein M3Y97_00543000 [Aphelenchoides bicaudatus]
MLLPQWRWTRRRSTQSLLICLFFAFTVSSIDALFEEPRPLVIWPDPMPSNKKPTTWSEKNFGQWCRNFSMNSHTQCPEGSSLHWYYCCGEMNTECCVGIQNWAVVIFGSFIILGIVIAIVSVLAYFDLLWSNKVESKPPKKPKQISKSYKTVNTGAIV